MKKSFYYKCLFSLIAILLGAPFLTYGQSDFFEIRTPNVMIIFDSSSSMNMNTAGNSVSSGMAMGVDSVSRNYEGGGDHPNSKLFIAKQALAEVLKEIEGVNLGFATYGQRKQEKWRGYFQRWQIVTPGQAALDWCEKRYWRWRSITTTDGPRYANDFAPDSFKDAWGFTRSGVTVGYRFYRTISLYDKPASSIPPHSNLKTKSYDWYYTVTDIKFNAEYGWYTYTYISDSLTYDYYEETIKSISGCTNCNPDEENNPFPVTWVDVPPWNTYFKNDSRGVTYKDEYDKPFGNTKPKYWDCNKKNQPYKDPVWGYYKTWLTYSGTQASACQNQAGGWEYLGPCYDVSEYYYPIGSAPALPYDATNRPHTWSYFRISANTWPNSIQPDPYYPATPDDPGKSDNNFFFLNFPEIDDSLNNYANKKKILQWLDLIPIQNPETLRWHTKLPLKSDSITSNVIGSLFTPLADTLGQAKKYFNDYIFKYKGGDDATKATCRGNYIILMTDGLESARFAGVDPDYGAAANAAKELFELVKDKNNNPAGVKTFVIGFGLGLMGNKPAVLDKIANLGGTTKAYFADNLGQLKDAFKAIFQAIGGNYSRSSPVVSTSRDAIYRGYFTLPGWEGHLVAYKLEADGSVGAKQWDAGTVMNSSGRGVAYTWAEDKFEPKQEVFIPGNAEKIKDKGNYLLNPSIEEDMNWDDIGKKIGDAKIDKDDSEAVIEFVLQASYKKYFDGSKDVYPYAGKRSPNWKLGDIYHSTPLIIGAPPLNLPDAPFPQKYSKYKEDNKARETVIYVGANDGMLHAFNGTDGKEKFAVIPRNLLGKLKEIRKDHQFFIDSSPRAYDVYHRKGKKKDEWKTIVVSGERGGGNYYFAIDVTDPNKKPEILWEMTDTAMGKTWSRPEIGLVRISAEEKFVAFVGGGYSSTDNIGNTFYAIDIEDGTILRKFVVGDKSNKVPAGATAFDSDLDGRVNGVYFGDIKGVLRKIKIDGEEDITKWQLITLNTPGTNTPVFYPPAVTKNNQGKIMVYYGQGDELNIFEQVSSNSFFEVWDKGDSGQMIWEEKLEKGEKVLASPAVTNNVVYFTTWLYTGVSDNCGAGKGRLYGLTTTSLGTAGDIGALLLDPLTGAEMGSKKKYFEITDYFPEAKGIPSGPIVTNGMIYVSTSLNAGQVITIPIPGWGTGKLKYWREVF
jgi:hypothetical protein